MACKVPNKLYKYKAIDEKGHTLDLIKNDFLYIGTVKGFNDAFEGALIYNPDEILEFIIENSIERLGLKINQQDYLKIINSDNPYDELKKWAYNDPQVTMSFERFSEILDEAFQFMINKIYENFNDNSKDARALFVYLNQINSKDTGKEISGKCIAFDEHNNIIFSRDIMRVDYSGECIFEFDYISEDIFNNINRIEIAFYDNGNLLYQNSTTDIHIHNYTISDCLIITRLPNQQVRVLNMLPVPTLENSILLDVNGQEKYHPKIRLFSHQGMKQ